MKFIKLESRGGNYLVVAENVAWLRTAEHGQTSVGIIGGQPLLVVGSIEEVAAKILAAAAHDEDGEANGTAAAAGAEATTPTADPAAAPRSRPAGKAAPSLRDRLPAASGLRVKAGSQRFMGMTE